MAEYKLINGDCLAEMRKMDSNSFDYAFTSPPYNRKRNDKYEHYNDNIEDYFKFLVDVTDEMLRLCKKGVFFNIQTTLYNRVDVYRYIGYYAEKIQEVFVWEKDNPMPAQGNHITNAVEYFFFLGNERPQSATTYTKNVVHSSVAIMPKEHKAVMNDKVCDWFITNFIPKGSKVLEPFAGYGTALLTCLKHDIDCVGIEIVPRYCEMIEERLGRGIQLSLFNL